MKEQKEQGSNKKERSSIHLHFGYKHKNIVTDRRHQTGDKNSLKVVSKCTTVN